MSESLDELYLRWLYRQVSSVRLRSPSKTYWNLLRQLYTKEYVWLIPNDDNRLEDGRDLRHEFLDFMQDEPDPDWMAIGCSFLEMLVALSRRLSFEDDQDVAVWFWILLDNLDLHEFNDAVYNDRVKDRVDEIMDDVIWRRYRYDGVGGLFPLKHPPNDQRKVEIWYQLSNYIMEME